jgi:hypothetical protein
MADLSAILSLSNGTKPSLLRAAARARAFSLQWLFLSVASVSSIEILSVFYYKQSAILSDDYSPLYRSSIAEVIGIVFSMGLILIIAWSLVALLSRVFPALLVQLIPWPMTPALVAQPNNIEKLLSQRHELNPTQIALLDRLVVMQEIDQRLVNLSERTSTILGTIAIALVVAGFVVIFAGRLTNLDIAAVSNVDRARLERDRVTSKLDQIYAEQEKLNDALEKTSSGNDKQRMLSRIKKLDTDTKDQMLQLESISKLQDEILRKELLPNERIGDWHYIAATAITRVGVVLIIVFLVQILMGLYRYNTRLMTYYSSRRDLLTLWEGDQKALKPLEQIMAPPKIDFGKEPKHPLEDLLKAIGSKLKFAEGPPKATP